MPDTRLRSPLALLFITLLSSLATLAQPASWVRPLQHLGPIPRSGSAPYRANNLQPARHLSVTDPHGTTYVTGTFRQSFTLAGTTLTLQRPGDNLFLARFDSLGALTWVRTAVAANATGATALALTLDAAGNPLLAARAYDTLIIGNSRQAGSHYLVSFSPTGTTRWIRPIPLHHARGSRPRLGISDLKAGPKGIYLLALADSLDAIGGFPCSAFDEAISIVRFSLDGTPRMLTELVESYHVLPRATGHALLPDQQGNFYFSGTFQELVFSSPNRGPDSIATSYNSADAGLLIKYDSTGRAIWWHQAYAFAASMCGKGLALDAAGDVYWTGYKILGDSQTDMELDYTWGNPVHQAVGSIYVAKFSPAGNALWLRGNTPYPILDDTNPAVKAHELVALAAGGVALVGTYRDSSRLGPFQLPRPDSIDLFLAHFTPAGVVAGLTSSGGPLLDGAYFLGRDTRDNLYVHGHTTSVTGFGGFPLQSSPPDTTGSFYLARFRRLADANRLTGVIYLDQNANGTRDPGEPPFPRAVELRETHSAYRLSTTDAFQMLLPDTGAYDLQLSSLPAYAVTQGSGGYQGTFTRFGQTAPARHFGLAPLPNQPDVRLTLSPLHPSRPGFANRYSATLENVGTTSATGTITLTLDPQLTYQTSNPPATVAGQTLSWSYTGLAPFARQTFAVELRLPATVPQGTALTSSAQALLAGDIHPVNNADTLQQVVVGSFDPNAKEVSHRVLTLTQVSARQPLTYTIHFQNLGTDTAFSVVIVDTLDSRRLVPTTLQFLGASHSCIWRVQPDGLLTVRFPNIRLPHAARDSAGSKGFVRFRAEPRLPLLAGDSIRNRAHITFDFNAPVVTNYAVTYIGHLPTGLPDQQPAAGFTLHPNPARHSVHLRGAAGPEVQLLDALGRVVRHFTTPSPHPLTTLDLKGLPPGLYLVRAGHHTRRLVVE